MWQRPFSVPYVRKLEAWDIGQPHSLTPGPVPRFTPGLGEDGRRLRIVPSVLPVKRAVVAHGCNPVATLALGFHSPPSAHKSQPLTSAEERQFLGPGVTKALVLDTGSPVWRRPGDLRHFVCWIHPIFLVIRGLARSEYPPASADSRARHLDRAVFPIGLPLRGDSRAERSLLGVCRHESASLCRRNIVDANHSCPYQPHPNPEHSKITAPINAP